MYAYSPKFEGTNTKADFRNDTVTRPTEAMMAAINAAEVGDDVYGEDPTTNALEARAAELLGKEAGLFLTSGTQSNLAGLLAHCGRGEEVLTGAGYHIAAWEAGGASVLGSVLISTPMPSSPTTITCRRQNSCRLKTRSAVLPSRLNTWI